MFGSEPLGDQIFKVEVGPFMTWWGIGISHTLSEADSWVGAGDSYAYWFFENEPDKSQIWYDSQPFQDVDVAQRPRDHISLRIIDGSMSVTVE